MSSEQGEERHCIGGPTNEDLRNVIEVHRSQLASLRERLANEKKPNPNTVIYPLIATNFIGQWFVMDAEGRAIACCTRQFHAETLVKNMNAYANAAESQA